MNGRFRPLRGAAWAVLALISCLALTSRAQAPRTFGEPLDISEDVHHRMLAGLFQPSKEPLVCVLADSTPGPSAHRPVPGAWLRVSWELGSFRVRSDAEGKVILHMDQQAALSHLELSASTDAEGLVRDFREFPTHPVQERSR